MRSSTSLDLIFNPAAGSFSNGKFRDIERHFHKAGQKIVLHPTAHAGHAEEIARSLSKKKHATLVACGGDGTLNEVVNGAAGSEAVVGLIPMGTANVVALECGISRNIAKACDVILHGKIIPVNLGKIKNRYFVFNASVGVDSFAVAHVNPRVKRLIGRGAYFLSALPHLRKTARHPLQVILDKKHSIQSYGLIVNTVRFYGGKYKLFPDASFQGTGFQICSFKRGGALPSMSGFAHIALNRARQCKHLEFFEAEHLRVEAGSDHPFQMDGTQEGRLPIELKYCPQAAQFLVPRKYGFISPAR